MIIDNNPKNILKLITNLRSWLDMKREWFIKVDHNPNNQLFIYYRREKQNE